MASTLVQTYIHLVYSTKYRTPWLRDAETRKRVHAYLAGACEKLDSPVFQVGGVEDHVHILFSLSKNIALKDLVGGIKKESSKWIKREFPDLSDFHWQSGYGAFSISPSHVPQLKQYILTQEEHHKTESFQDEFRRLCRKYGIAIDERFAWD